MKTHIIAGLIIITTFFSSCHPYKKITYLNGIEERDTVWPKNKPEYRLKPQDILYIRIVSPDEKVNTLYNPLMGGSQGGVLSSSGGENSYLYGYQVSDSGTIVVPVLGNFHVSGLTMDEAGRLIQQRTDQYLKDALAIVRLFEFQVNFIGQLNASLSVKADQLTLLEAIAKAGGLPYTGQWRSLMIIRQEENGTRTIPVDPTDPGLLASEKYYLQPNDIIYLKPNALTKFRVTYGNILLVVASVTTAVSSVLILMSK